MKKTLISFIIFFSFIFSSAYAAKAELDVGMVNPGHEDKPKWFKNSFLDLKEDVEEATDSNKRLIVYFYQDGCPYCAKFLKDNFRDRGIAKKTQKHFDVIAINMWGDKEVIDFSGNTTTEKKFSKNLKIQYTPTVLIMDENSKVGFRMNGYYAPHKFNAALDYMIEKQETIQSFNEYFLKVSPSKVSGKLHEVKSSLATPLKLKDDRKKSFRHLVVMFEQKTCLDCDELHKNILTRPLVAYALTNLDVAVVDMWSKEKVQLPNGQEKNANDWAKELDIKYAPSLVFFDEAGSEVFRTEAYLKSFHIHGAIDYVVSGAYRAEPDFQRYLQNRSDKLHARGLQFDLMN